MFIKLLTYWKNQTNKEKLFIGALIFALSYGVFITIEKSIIKYQYFKQVEKEHQQLTETVKEYQDAEIELLDKNVKATKRAEKKVVEIDTKLKQDEKRIDNGTVSDDDIAVFLAEYD